LIALSGENETNTIPVLDDLLNSLAEIYQCLKPKKRGMKKKTTLTAGNTESRKKAKGRPLTWDDDMHTMLLAIIDGIKSEENIKTDKGAIDVLFSSTLLDLL